VVAPAVTAAAGMGEFFQQMPIRVKAFAASVVLLVCLIAIGGYAYEAAEKSALDFKELSRRSLPKQEMISNLNREVIGTHVQVFRFVTWASNGVNARLLNSISEDVLADLVAVSRRFASLTARADLSAAEHAAMADLSARWEKYVAAVKDTLDVGRTDAPMATMMLGATDDDFQKVAADLGEIADLAGAQTRAAAQEFVTRSEMNRKVLALGVVAATLLSFFVALVVSRSIVEPIQSVTRAMTEVSAGNVDFDLGDQTRRDEIGQMVRAIATFRQNLGVQTLRLDTALNNMSQGLGMFDAAQRVVVCNDRFARMYGLSPEQARPGTSLRQIVERRIENGFYAGENPAQYMKQQLAPVVSESNTVEELSDGRAIFVSCQPMADGGWVTTHEDISERRRIEKQIAHMASHDALTGLANRTRLIEKLDRALAEANEAGSGVAVHFIDLDRFKDVNDNFGHHGGDVLLRTFAERLCAMTRPDDEVARLGGDEFVVLQAGIAGAADAEDFARRVAAALSAPVRFESYEIRTTVSIGLALSPGDGDSPERLLKCADQALYRAKADGRNCVRCFLPEMDAQMRSRVELENAIRNALLHDRFVLYYQPIFETKSRTLLGFEALIRLPVEDGTLIAPMTFIPVAEDLHLIDKVGAWVLRKACHAAVRWPEHLTVAVNVSAAQFRAGGVCAMIAAALQEADLAAHRLEVEITESLLLDDSETVMKELRIIKALGVAIVMDDFGSGYSSLSYLWRFPFDKIKIDQSFMTGLSRAGRDAETVVKTILALGRELRVHVTVEGVETAEQMSFVDEANAEQAQGFYLGRPVPESEIAANILVDFKNTSSDEASPPDGEAKLRIVK
jgi:diguanylate cyclase (GGDEF)-like protein